MFQRYNQQARRVVFFARQAASEHGVAEIGTVGLLLAMLDDNRDLMAGLLRGGAEEVDRLRAEVDALHPRSEKEIPASQDLPVTHSGQRALRFAEKEADRRHHRDIEPLHLLAGLLREKGPETACLKAHGITAATVAARFETSATDKHR